MAFNQVYGAGLLNGSIRLADGSVHNIEAIVDIVGAPKQTDVTIDGNDAVKAVFSSNRVEDITITANAITLDVIQAITGNSVSSSAGGSQIALGSMNELTPPFVEVSGQITGIDAQTGTQRVITKTWHRVQLRMTTIASSNGKEMNCVLVGTAYLATNDVLGVPLNSRRVATLAIN
jgi:hypothetical protein